MRKNRQVIFDLNRNYNSEEMAHQEIEALKQALQLLQQQQNQLPTLTEVEALRQTLQQTQQQHQQEITTLRQGLATQPILMFQLSPDKVLSKFQHIKTFYGTEDYPLREFISAVENIAELCGSNQQLLQYGFSMVFKEKIQGEARRCIERLGKTPTWERVKSELKVHFKPRKSYRQLMDEGRSVKVSNLRELFNIMKSINAQLNELYEFDDNKPSNYSPDNNDKNLVELIRDMINGSYRTNISRNMTLIQVYNIFDELELLDEHDVIHYKYRSNCNNKETKHNSAFGMSKRRNQIIQRNNTNYQENNNRLSEFRNSDYRNNINYSGYIRREQNSGQIKNFNYNHNPRQFRNSNFNNNNSGQFRQNGQSGQYRNSYNSTQTRHKLDRGKIIIITSLNKWKLTTFKNRT